MFKNATLTHAIVWNVMMITMWHCVVFFACVKLPKQTFDPSKNRYQAFRWEQNGRWYRTYLKIQLWKDSVPQYIGKDGFSKKHLTRVSPEYIDEFMLETCRGEWMHLKNCICVVVVIIVNSSWVMGLVFSGLIFLGNLPFVCIQRYNRFRLQTLREILIKERARARRLEARSKETALRTLT